MEVYQNLAINLGGLPILGLLWKRDKDAQDSLLERIQKGGYHHHPQTLNLT